MEESKDLQTLYKVFRTFIYVSLIVEFFEYAINPDVLDHWGGILVEIHDRLKLLDVYQNGHLHNLHRNQKQETFGVQCQEDGHLSYFYWHCPDVPFSMGLLPTLDTQFLHPI